MNKKGKLYIISAPSGTGKSTVIRELLKKKDNAFFSVSATTREPREGEVNGVNYWFLTRPEFERMVEEGAFLEHAQYVGNYYGTPLQPILDSMAAGNDAILDIEVQGFRQIKQKIPGHLGILGVAVNNAPRSSQIMPVISYKITSVLGLYQFKTVIHHSANAQKATAGGLLFSQIDGNANAEFEQLGKEILERHAVSTAWESYRRQQTDELLKKYKDDLEYRDMTDSEILDEIRKEYTRGDLWDKPKSIPDERYWKENK